MEQQSCICAFYFKPQMGLAASYAKQLYIITQEAATADFKQNACQKRILRLVRFTCLTAKMMPRFLANGLASTFFLVLFCWASEGATAAKKPDYDVCVIGAGGSGAYAAVTLKDLGHSVLVLEKEARVRSLCLSASSSCSS